MLQDLLAMVGLLAIVAGTAARFLVASRGSGEGGAGGAEEAPRGAGMTRRRGMPGKRRRCGAGGRQRLS